MSYDGYQGHVEAVGAAQNEVQELQNLLIMANEKREQTLGAIAHAVGDQPSADSGRNAMAMVSEVGDLLDRAAGMCESAKTEMERYAGSF